MNVQWLDVTNLELLTSCLAGYDEPLEDQLLY